MSMGARTIFRLRREKMDIILEVSVLEEESYKIRVSSIQLTHYTIYHSVIDLLFAHFLLQYLLPARIFSFPLRWCTIIITRRGREKSRVESPANNRFMTHLGLSCDCIVPRSIPRNSPPSCLNNIPY